MVARREAEELRIDDAPGGLVLDGDATILDQPDAVTRAVAAVRCPNAGEVIVSARGGLGVPRPRRPPSPRRRQHGSLARRDSLVPDADGRPRRAARAASSTSRRSMLEPLRRRGAAPVRRFAGGVSAAFTSQLAALRRDGRASAAPPRDRRRARARGDGASCPRELFVPPSSCAERVRRRGAADRPRADDLAAVHRRRDVRAARAAAATSACSTSARARGTRPPCSPSSRRGDSIERIPALARGGARRARRGGLRRASTCRSATARLGAPDHAPFDAIAVAAASAACRRRSTSSLRSVGGSSSRAGSRGQRLVAILRTAGGPVETASLGCRFVPLVAD